MTQIKKARLSAAVAAALGGAALSAIPVIGQALPPDTAYYPPQGFAEQNRGQVVIVPYYSTNGGWYTTFGITNTTDSALAVRARFHEAANSRDVLDFIIFLSPEDRWGGLIQAGPDGTPVVSTPDNSCTAPAFPEGGAALKDIAFTGDEFSNVARMTEGYIEFLVMGEIAPGDPGYNTGVFNMIDHGATGTPGDCAGARAMAFDANEAQWPDEGERWDGGVPGTPVNSMSGMMANQVGTSSALPPAIAGRTGAPGYMAGSFVGAVPVTGTVTVPVTVPVTGEAMANAVVPGWVWDGTPAAGETGFGGVRSPAPLQGEVGLINVGRGLGGGTEGLHLAALACTGIDPAVPYVDVGTAAAPRWIPNCTVGLPAGTIDPADAYPIESNVLMTPHVDKYWYEPTIATYNMGLWDVRGLSVLEQRFTWSEVTNTWLNNPTNNAYSDWVITFPTKGYHVDQTCDDVGANNNAWRNDGINVLDCDGAAFVACPATSLAVNTQDGLPVGACNEVVGGQPVGAFLGGNADGSRAIPYAARVAPFRNTWNGTEANVANNVTLAFWDGEEQMGVSEQPFSPGGATFNLPYEVNVITFTINPDEAPLQSPLARSVDTAEQLPEATNGWARIAFTNELDAPENYVGWSRTSAARGWLPSGELLNGYQGLPAYGISMTTYRSTGAGEPNPTGMMKRHSYGFEAP